MQAVLLGEAAEVGEVEAAGEIDVALLFFVQVPEGVGFDGVEAGGAKFLEEVGPHFGSGAGVMDRTGEEEDTLLVDEDGAGVEGDLGHVGTCSEEGTG